LVVALRKTQQSEFEQEREMQSQELSKQSEHYQRAAEREAAERERLNAEATARAQEIVALQEQSTQDRQLISKQQGEIAALQAKMVAIIDQCKTEKQTLITQAKQKINTWIDAYKAVCEQATQLKQKDEQWRQEWEKQQEYIAEHQLAQEQRKTVAQPKPRPPSPTPTPTPVAVATSPPPPPKVASPSTTYYSTPVVPSYAYDQTAARSVYTMFTSAALQQRQFVSNVRTAPRSPVVSNPVFTAQANYQLDNHLEGARQNLRATLEKPKPLFTPSNTGWM
jgi:hypothetical protein